MSDIFDARRELVQRTASIDDKLDKIVGTESKKTTTPTPPAPGATNFAQAKRSERVGSEGERSFGSPIARPEISSENRAEGIRKAQEDRIAKLNLNAQAQKANQSTDAAN